ncbi:uncharacterized protein LOC121754260 [Salvia splendens]|uniref:uncharacterized protein LOC121754260 n=1 Tax=Salvia splendens TaxID=180675 RepID=UPI001C25880C|nr:uncharacterized protein LOC121754260 [Salvia splendens]
MGQPAEGPIILDREKVDKRGEVRIVEVDPRFDPFFEIPIVAIWCNILALPVHLFEESSLVAIGEMLGKPVQVDRATITRSRVSFARICVEVDLSRPIPEEIDIDIAGKHVTLKVKWDKIPLYCNECKHVGHSAMSCYASGRRPMPPKRDYSQRPTPQNGPPPNREGESHQAGPSRQPQGPRYQPFASQPTERPPPEVGQPRRQERRNQGVVIRDPAPGPISHHGPSSAAAEGSQVAWDDGFVVPKKKNKAKKKNKGKKKHENRTSARTVSEGEGHQGMEADESSSGNERGSRSRSPSITRGFGYGPLAMVVHGDNMFGALEDFPSDDAEVEVDSDDHQDHMICEVPNTRLEHDDPVLQYIGPTSPPAEGSSKKARLSASGAY